MFLRTRWASFTHVRTENDTSGGNKGCIKEAVQFLSFSCTKYIHMYIYMYMFICTYCLLMYSKKKRVILYYCIVGEVGKHCNGKIRPKSY